MVDRRKCEIVSADTNVRCHREVRYIISIHDDSAIPNLAPVHAPKNNLYNRWWRVCGTHDRLIGRYNLIAQGWTKSESIMCERDPAMRGTSHA